MYDENWEDDYVPTAPEVEDWNDEIPVDFEGDWYQSVLDRAEPDDGDDVESIEARRVARVEIRETQYMLGRHLRTKRVRIITNRPAPAPVTETVTP